MWWPRLASAPRSSLNYLVNCRNQLACPRAPLVSFGLANVPQRDLLCLSLSVDVGLVNNLVATHRDGLHLRDNLLASKCTRHCLCNLAPEIFDPEHLGGFDEVVRPLKSMIAVKVLLKGGLD